MSCITCGCCDEEDYADSGNTTSVTDVTTALLIVALLYVGYTLFTGGKLSLPVLPSAITKVIPQETLVVVALIAALLFSVGAVA